MVPGNRIVDHGVFPLMREEYEMRMRCRFTADFKAKVALPGDRTIQEIAARHKVHPNQVSAWKRQTVDGLNAVFSNGEEKASSDRETEIHDLHAKIG